ncbi:hypothetical protein [Blastococcus sp. SYSU D00813]
MDDVELPLAYTWRRAREAGARRRQIAADGVRLGHGLYLSRAAPATLAARCSAWTRLLPADAAFGMQTAVALLGADDGLCRELRAPDVHVVLTPRPVPPRRRGLVVHERALLAGDVVEAAGLRVTSGARTFLDLALHLPPQELVAVGDALLRQGRMDEAALAARLALADRVKGVVRARECAPLLSAEARSRPESLIRYWLATSDLPAPDVQVPVRDRWGREVAHADVGYERYRVAVEYEGRQHADPEQFGRDVDRYSLMAADGWLVLRFAGRHLGGPGVVVDRTRRALVSRGWRDLRAAPRS